MKGRDTVSWWLRISLYCWFFIDLGQLHLMLSGHQLLHSQGRLTAVQRVVIKLLPIICIMEEEHILSPPLILGLRAG